MSLADALEAAATALPEHADAIRPANGDPDRLLALLGAAAPPVLAWLLSERPEDGAELAEAWADAEDGANAVLAVAGASLPKAGRKVLRRVLHRLRSRGLELPEPAPAPVVARLRTADDPFRGAWVSPLDGAGVRLVYLAEPNPSGGVRLFEVVLDDERGVAGFEVYTAPRKHARAFLQSLRTRERFAVVEAPEDAVRALVARAAARQPADRPAPRSFREWRSRVAAVAEGAATPGEQARAALGDGDTGALQRAVALVHEGRVGPWPAAGDALRLLFERLRAAAESPLVVSGAAQRERAAALVAEAAAEIYAGDGAESAAHRFRESAYVFWKGGDEEAARACLAAAARLEEGGGADHPVAVALLEAALGPALAALERAPEAGPASGEGRG